MCTAEVRANTVRLPGGAEILDQNSKWLCRGVGGRWLTWHPVHLLLRLRPTVQGPSQSRQPW